MPKISEMDLDSAIGGSENIPASDEGTPKRITPEQIKDYAISMIEAIEAGESVTGDDGVYILQDGELKPVDIDMIVDYVFSAMWGKTAETAPDSADIMTLKDGETEKTVTLEKLADYIKTTIKASILDVSSLDALTTPADTDVYLITSGSTGKKITHANLLTAIYSGLASHVTDKDAVTTPADTDVLYVVQSGTGKKVTLSQLAGYIGGNISGSGTADLLAQWVDGDTLKAGPGIIKSTDGFDAGSDSMLPTTKAVRNEMNEIINDSEDIDDDIADADTILVDDGASGTQRKSTFTRVWTWIVNKLAAITDVSSYSWVLDEDDMASDSATKVPTQQSVKAFSGNIENLDIDGATDIGSAIGDADLIVIDDGANGTNRKSAFSRVWAYIALKLAALADISGYSWVIDEDDMSSDSAAKVPTQQSVKAYVDSQGAWDGDITDMDIDGAVDIGADLADADLIVVDDGAGGTNRKSTFTRVWAWITGKLAALTDVSSYSWVLDEDDFSSNSATKVPTQQSVKEYVDNSAASPWDGDITDMDIDGAVDIGADLADADLIVVDDGAGGTNRKSAISRIWTYIVGKIQGLSAKTSPVDDDILTIQDSEDSNSLKELTLSNFRKLGINSQTGTAYTLVLADQYKYVRLTNADAITLTVPPNSSVAFPVGVAIPIIQGGAGQVTVAEGSGVTVNKSETLNLRGQYSAATLLKIDTDEWDLIGDLEESS